GHLTPCRLCLVRSWFNRCFQLNVMPLFQRLKSRSSIRSQNLMLCCTMSHASDWLLVPPIHGLGLGLQSEVFRTALKFRLSIPLFSEPFPCPTLSNEGKSCPYVMDVLLCFRHNNVRDIMGHAARGAGLAAVVIEKKNQIDGS